MPTKFGKFISGKHFSKLFLILYLFFMGFTAYETNAAFCQLTGRTHVFCIPYIVFVLFAVLILTKRNVTARWNSAVYKKFMGFVSSFFIYYFFVLLAWELVCSVFRITGMFKAVGIITAIILPALLVLAGYLCTKKITVKNYALSFGKARKKYRIAFMSDLHLGVFVGEKHVKKIVENTNKLNPDVVVISGDIFDVDNALLNDKGSLNQLSKILQRIKASEGVYAVVGNHDPKVDNPRFQKFLKASNIRLLDNDVAVLSAINLVGRTDKASNERTDYESFADRLDPLKPVVVLDHTPEEITEDVQHGANLVLCGHTHRGQMFPITLLTKWANGRKFFYGHETFDESHAIITSGIGFFELPVRLGTYNEIVDIELRV